MIDLIALSSAKKHADLLAMGLTSVSVNNTNKSITFTLAADGSQHTIYFDQPSDGVSIIGVEIKNGHLICLMSDGSEIDAGVLPSGSGGGSVPKPLTYDYMPEGYPSKSIQDVTLLENQEITFDAEPEGYRYQGTIEVPFELVDGKTYVVTWDGSEYECLASTFNDFVFIGNLALLGVGDDTGEPFISNAHDGIIGFVTSDTNRVHIITIKTETEAITPIADEFIPDGHINELIDAKLGVIENGSY